MLLLWNKKPQDKFMYMYTCTFIHVYKCEFINILIYTYVLTNIASKYLALLKDLNQSIHTHAGSVQSGSFAEPEYSDALCRGSQNWY